MSGFSGAGTVLGLADEKQCIAAVIGCGGKTAFIKSLADEYRHKKVLITPTTKILPMRDKNVVLCSTLPECRSHIPVNGIQCLGLLNDKTGKLEALPMPLLEETVKHYDLVLLEADGSGGLPCKGWLPDEPVIPPFCTHTIGIVSLNALGKPADGETVLRLPEFLKLTGLRRGEIITVQSMVDMVCADDGMFHNGIGRQVIFVNQVEEDTAAAAAREWLRYIRQAYPGRFACLSFGSARLNRWKEV